MADALDELGIWYCGGKNSPYIWMECPKGMDSWQFFDALLEYVSPKGVEQNGAIQFEIKAAVTIPDDAFIRAGYSANAEIVLKRAEDVLTLPESCIEFAGDSTFVQVVTAEQPKQTFERRQVTVGLSDGIRIEIKSGLKEDERVRGSIIDDDKK